MLLKTFMHFCRMNYNKSKMRSNDVPWISFTQSKMNTVSVPRARNTIGKYLRIALPHDSIISVNDVNSGISGSASDGLYTYIWCMYIEMRSRFMLNILGYPCIVRFIQAYFTINESQRHTVHTVFIHTPTNT